MNSSFSISVVIRTFNSGKTLDAVLSSLRVEEGDEFIVVDSGSTDSTLAIAQKHGATIVKAPPPFNYSKSLNLGFAKARNAWVLVISSHCLPLVDLMAVYRSQAALFPGPVVVGYGVASLTGKTTLGAGGNKTQFYGAEEYPLVSSVCGNANTIYRYSAWRQIPFDETIRTAEDKIWIEEALKQGFQFAYIPSAEAINKNQGSLSYMFGKGYSDARALPRSKHPQMRLYHLAGALKNLAKQRLVGKIDTPNWLRYSAHIFGQFFGSRQSEDNTPKGSP